MRKYRAPVYLQHRAHSLTNQSSFCLPKPILRIRLQPRNGYWVVRLPCHSRRMANSLLNKFTAAVWKSWGPGADQVPLLMLPKRIDVAMVQFYTLTKGQIYDSNLPETRVKACVASLGWLVTVTRDEGELKFKMLHPSTYAKIELPDGGACLLRYPLENILKFVLSSNPCLTADYIVMFHSYSSLGFCHNQNESTIGCRVYKVPFSNGNSWSNSEVKNLGNRALFLSRGSSCFSVQVSGNSGCKPNCIYFMNNKTVSPFADLDVGIYNMEDGTVDRDFRSSFNTGFEEIIESHLWIQPSLSS